MQRAVFALLMAVVLSAAMTARPRNAVAQETEPRMSVPADAEDPDAFGQRVRAYLLANPEVIMEAVQILQDRQQAAQAEAVRATIAARADDLLRDPAAPVGGNPAGDVTLVEFFDYNCQYCRSVAPTVAEVLRADPDLRLVYKEFPILGPSSEVAARAALAAERQGRYAALHEALMQLEKPLTEEKIVAAAAGVGLDTARLRRDMADPAVDAAIRRNRLLAAALGINGTPAFVIGDEVVPGAVDRATLDDLVARARDC